MLVMCDRTTFLATVTLVLDEFQFGFVRLVKMLVKFYNGDLNALFF